MNGDIKRVLDYLNRNKIRATYGAVGDYLGLPRWPMPNWDELLVARSPYSSWIVRTRDGLPGGYALEELHPDLESQPEIITEGKQLKEILDANTN